MKKFCLLLLLVLVASLAFASTAVWYKVSLFRRGLQVELPGNPTTGYQWVVRQDDGMPFSSVKESYKASKAESGMVGVGGTYRAVLQKPLAAGTFILTFSYERSWEKDSPAEVRRLQVTVNERMKIESIEEI